MKLIYVTVLGMLVSCGAVKSMTHFGSSTLKVHNHNSLPVPTQLKPGNLDKSFGVAGASLYQLSGTTENSANDIAIDRFGRIVVAGQTTVGAESRFALARLNADGKLDLSFAGGIVTADIVTSNTLSNYANAIAIDSENRIVAAGVYNGDPAIIRYTEDGQLDTTFGAAGVTTTSVSGINLIQDIAIDSEGRIVAIGYSYDDAEDETPDALVLRYNSNGGLDTSFGESGYVAFELSQVTVASYVIAVDSQDRIIIAGHGENKVTVGRLTSEGEFDTTFGTSSGYIATTVSSTDAVYGVKLDSKNRIIVAGAVESGAGYSIFIMRLTADGLLDTTFNGTGSNTYSGPADSASSETGGVVVDPLDRIIVVKSEVYSEVVTTIIARVLPTGALDQSFGVYSNGISRVHDVDAAFRVNTIALNHQGKVVVGGISDNSFAFTCFTSDYTLEYYRKQFAASSLGFLG